MTQPRTRLVITTRGYWVARACYGVVAFGSGYLILMAAAVFH